MDKAALVSAVICAAGSSSRMGGIKKEYQKLRNSEADITVLGSVVRAFASVPSVEIIVIAIPENEEAAAREALPGEYLNVQKPKILLVAGGQSRSASVFNALCVLENYDTRYVLIHDGARPWVSTPLIENIIDAVKKHDAVIPLLPPTETPKELDAPLSEQAFITRHLKRANTGFAQTPQGFKFTEILHAHEKAAQVKDEEFTDDAEVWGRFCGPVAVIPGEIENKKITFQEDL